MRKTSTHKRRPNSRSRRRSSLRRWAIWMMSLCVVIAVGYGSYWLYESTGQNPSQALPNSHDGTTRAITASPKYLSIPSLSIDRAEIVPVGTTADGDMADPDSYQQVGWYKDSARPGDGQGALLLNGHYGAANETAIFQYLDKLQVGATITLETSDTKSIDYKVYFTEHLPIEQVDMRKMLRSANPDRQGLNIITCSGRFDTTRDTYDDRLLVYAVEVKD